LHSYVHPSGRTCALLAACVLIAAGTPLFSTPETAGAIDSAQTIVRVSSENELREALSRLVPQTTVLLAPGTYRLSASLTIASGDVTLAGAGASPGDVQLVAQSSDPDAMPQAIVVTGARVTLTNFTLRGYPDTAVRYVAGAGQPRVRALWFLDNAGAIHAERLSGLAMDGGVIEDSRVQRASTSHYELARDAIVVTGGRGWVVRRNVFRDVRRADGLPRATVRIGAAADNAVVEANTFIDCELEIALAADGGARGPSGVQVRNNFITRAQWMQGAAAITITNAPGARVLHNTALLNGSHPAVIELRSSGTVQGVVRNNLLDGPVVTVGGAAALIESNETDASPAMFVNAAAGDLHLLESATTAIGRAVPEPSVAFDWDGQPRPGDGADIGADEFSAAAAGANLSTLDTSPSRKEGGTTTFAMASTVESSSLTTTATSLPAPWVTQDVGSPSVAGSAAFSSGTFTVKGAGADIWRASDQFRFVYQPLAGDGQVVARVGSLQHTATWAKAGVMIRETLRADAVNAYALVSAGGGLSFQHRAVTGGTSVSVGTAGGAAPVWLRLVRRGSQFTASRSADGVTWTTLGTATLSMGSTVYVGLAVTSNNATTATTATFTNVAVTAGLPTPWVSQDVGSPAVAGSATFSSGTFTVKGAGADIWRASDQFRFVYQPLAGDGQVIARVGSLQHTATWAKAGVMIRETLRADAVNAYALVSAGGGLSFQHRAATGGTSVSVGTAGGAAPVWLRLVRRGSQFTASRSADGVTWTTLGTATLSMGSTVYVGLAVTSHNATTATTATFANVTVWASGVATSQRRLVFTPSPDHSTLVTKYVFEVFPAGANPSTATPARTQDLGKPAVVNGEIAVNVGATIEALAPGSYFSTVRAVGSAGSTRSAPSNTFVR
jgi:regulation of enolase protein 1 (concanavalin A-like superfamily)